MKTKSIKKEDQNTKRHLTANTINALIDKYKHVKQKPTIIGKGPYEPFLAGITEDTWMSIGDKIRDE